MQDPVFESQTKTRLGSTQIEEGGSSMYSLVLDFLKKALDDFLHKNLILQRRFLNELRKAKGAQGYGWRQEASKSAKKANLHNRGKELAISL